MVRKYLWVLLMTESRILVRAILRIQIYTFSLRIKPHIRLLWNHFQYWPSRFCAPISGGACPMTIWPDTRKVLNKYLSMNEWVNEWMELICLKNKQRKVFFPPAHAFCLCPLPHSFSSPLVYAHITALIFIGQLLY